MTSIILFYPIVMTYEIFWLGVPSLEQAKKLIWAISVLITRLAFLFPDRNLKERILIFCWFFYWSVSFKKLNSWTVYFLVMTNSFLLDLSPFLLIITSKFVRMKQLQTFGLHYYIKTKSIHLPIYISIAIQSINLSFTSFGE